MEKQFLKKPTKTGMVFLAVLSAIAIIAIIMISMVVNVGDHKLTLIFTMSAVALAVANVWNGLIQIRVFNDFKSQRKSLCAEGIFSMCLTILIVITYMLFSTLQLKELIEKGKLAEVIDLRWFIGVFISAFTVWKIFSIKTALKEKRKNWWLEIVIGVLWLAYAILVFVTISNFNDAIKVILTVVGLLLIVAMSVYNLFSYIYTVPQYLITEDAISILEKEQREREGRLARFHMMQGSYATVNNNMNEQKEQVQEKKEETIEEKLAKIESLRQKGLISDEEFEEKRKKIIDSL